MVDIDRLLTQYPGAIVHIKNPTEHMWIKVLKQDGSLLQHARRQSWWMSYTAIKQNSAAIAYVSAQDNELCLLAVTLNPLTYSLIRNPSQAVRRRAIMLRPSTFFALGSPRTPDDWRVFLRYANNFELCSFLLRNTDFTAEERRLIVTAHPGKITLIENRSPEDECCAISKDPAVFIPLAYKCSEQAIWHALKLNTSNLFFCPDPTRDMCYFVGPDVTAMRYGLTDLLVLFFHTGIYFSVLDEKNIWVQIFLTMINQ